MLGGGKRESSSEESRAARHAANKAARPTPCAINPRSVVESMLFVGRPDNGPISARELAAAMRGVSPDEIEAVVTRAQCDVRRGSNAVSDRTIGRRISAGAAARIRADARQVLWAGEGARLSPAVLEVLSVLAYNQPATVEQLNELRGSPCGAALATLVRRKLVRVDARPRRGDNQPQYSTTERFLKLFGSGKSGGTSAE